MKRSVRYTKGLGNSALALRIPDGATWYDFTHSTWVGSESSDTRILGTERANSGDSVESRYEFSFTAPTTAIYSVEVYAVETGETIEIGDTADPIGFSTLDTAGVRSAVGLATANLDTQLSGINSKTINLPSDPADESLIVGATDAIMTRIGAAGAGLTALGDTRLANLDATISSRNSATPPTTSDIATAVWGSATRSLTTFGSLVSDTATAVWGAATRTLSGFGFTVPATIADKTGYSLTVTPPTLAQIEASAILAKEATAGAIMTRIGADGAGLTAIPKTGYKLASDGLDSINTTAPTGVASNFREMLIQTWRSIFKKSAKTSSSIITYADNGTTPITTQSISDDGAGNQSRGSAS